MRAVFVSALFFAALISCAFAYPFHPGTCVASEIPNGHGISDSNCTSCYSLSFKKIKTSGKETTYKVTLNGSFTFKGLLLYATDSKTHERFGAFSKPAQGFAPLHDPPSLVCPGKNPAVNTMGHTDNTLKNLPISFTWSDGGHKGAAFFEGVVVSQNMSDYYAIPRTTLHVKSGKTHKKIIA